MLFFPEYEEIRKMIIRRYEMDNAKNLIRENFDKLNLNSFVVLKNYIKEN